MHIHTRIFTIRLCTAEAQGYRELLFELGGGLLENVFLIFSFPSASVDRTSLCAAFYWSQRQQAERSVKFSSFSLSSSPLSLFLQACICFIAFPSFPHAIAVIFPFPPTSFSCTFLHFSSFTGSSPALGLSLLFLSASFPLCSPMVL